jgi:hypothetical protein
MCAFALATASLQLFGSPVPEIEHDTVVPALSDATRPSDPA